MAKIWRKLVRGVKWPEIAHCGQGARDERGQSCGATSILLNGVSADAGFTAGEGVAGSVEDFVVLVMLLAEGAEIGLAGPAVDGEVAAGNVGVVEQFGAQVAGRGAEKLCPGALGAIGGFKAGDFIFGNFELPDDDKHIKTDPVCMVAHGCRHTQ